MKKSLIIAALSIPILIFIVFFGVAIVLLITELVNGRGYNNGWLGIVYGGSSFSFFALVLSTIPTIVLGIPAALLADKYNRLNRKTILIGATSLGSLFLLVFGKFYFNTFDIELLTWLVVIGALGGLFNGYVFLARL